MTIPQKLSKASNSILDILYVVDLTDIWQITLTFNSLIKMH